jgi:hypothetical protein
MVDNTWRHEHEWPLTRTVWTNYYLHAGGVLSTTPPAQEAEDTYTYDPGNPTPYLVDARELELNINENYQAVHAENLGATAEQFDQIHSVYRAQQTGSLDHILPPARLRPYLLTKPSVKAGAEGPGSTTGKAAIQALADGGIRVEGARIGAT